MLSSIYTTLSKTPHNFQKLGEYISRKPVETLFILYFAVPFLFVPDSPDVSKNLRLIAYIGGFSAVIAFQSLRSELVTNIRQLAKPIKYALLAIFLAMTISSVMAQGSLDVVLFGLSPEYLGVFSWLLFFVLGLVFMRRGKEVLSAPSTLYVGLGVLLLSLVSNAYYIANGYRLSGVMFQATTMAMYGLVLCVLSLNQLVQKRINNRLAVAGLGIAVTTVLLSQSRAGYAVLILVLAVAALKHTSVSRRILAVSMTALMVAVALVPQLMPTYFSRFQSDSVSKGIAYRSDMYQTAVPDIAKNNLLLGQGPSSLPVGLNNYDTVPEELAVTLDQGYMFFSSHDLYFDFAYFFGGIAALILLSLTILAVWKHFIKDRQRTGVLPLLFIVLFANALINIPSLELTSLFFMVLFAMLQQPKPNKR